MNCWKFTLHILSAQNFKLNLLHVNTAPTWTHIFLAVFVQTLRMTLAHCRGNWLELRIDLDPRRIMQIVLYRGVCFRILPLDKASSVLHVITFQL